MKNCVVVDFETRSHVNLKKMGSVKYIHHPSTEIMSGVWKYKEQVVVWCPALVNESKDFRDKVNSKLGLQVIFSKEPPSILKQWAKLPWLAHNADAFDKELWDAKLPSMVKKPSLYKPIDWIDSIHLARMADLPAGLKMLLPKVMPDCVKDDPSAMLYLTEGKVCGYEQYFLRANPETWYKMLRYNILDVVNLEELFDKMNSMINNDFENHIKSINTHRAVNDYGLMVDVKWLNNLLAHWDILGKQSSMKASNIAGYGINLRSTDQVMNAINRLGLKLSGGSLNKTLVDKLLDDPSKFVDTSDDGIMLAIELLALRQDVAKASIGKLRRIAKAVEGMKEAIIRNWAVWAKAHTWRYASVGIQLHNLARGEGATGEMDRWPIKELSQRKKPLPSGLLTELTRGCFIPRPKHKMGIYDYEAIEARFCAWAVGCTTMMGIYEKRGDPYCEFASKIYGSLVTKADKSKRFVGKQGVLACQFQVGASKLQVMCEAYGINLADVGVTPEQVVTAFRKEYPEYPRFWKQLNDACLAVVGMRENEVKLGGPKGDSFTVMLKDEGLLILLPNGRPLRYNNPRIVHKPAPWDAKRMIPGLTYDHPLYGPTDTYGGKLTENIVQAGSRDIFQLNMDKGKERIILHTHDEAVIQIPEGKGMLTRFTKYGMEMSKNVEWAPGLAIGVEGFIIDRYCKEPLKGTKKYHFLMGKVV